MRRVACELFVSSALPRSCGGGILFSVRRQSSTEASSSSSPSSVVHTTDAPIEGVKIISLHSPPVNTLTSSVITEYLAALHRAIDPNVITKNDKGEDTPNQCRGIILTSELPTVFSSGMDLKEFLKQPLDRKTFDAYIQQLVELYCLLHRYPVPVIAAINGHAIGGGCIVSCACDYRVMARRPSSSSSSQQAAAGGAANLTPSPEQLAKKLRPFTIGIPVTNAGFAPPHFAIENMEIIIGKRRTEQLILEGKSITADEALKIGLVDEVVEESNQVVVAALVEMEKHLEMPSAVTGTRQLIKEFSRHKLGLEKHESKEMLQHAIDHTADMFSDPRVHHDLQRYVDSMTSSKKQQPSSAPAGTTKPASN